MFTRKKQESGEPKESSTRKSRKQRRESKRATQGSQRPARTSYCKACGEELIDGACPEHGRPCPACGEPAPGKYCPACGTNISKWKPPADKKKKSAKKAQKEIERVMGAKVAQSTNDLTGIELLYDDGMALNDDGTFSLTMEFGDISYEHERRDVQNDIYDKLSELHGSFQPPMRYQINLVNFPVKTAATRRYLEESGPTRLAARAYNKLIGDRQRRGRTLFERRNFISFSMPAEDADDAARRMASTAEATANHFQAMKCRSRVLDGEQRAHVLHDLLRGPDEPFFLDKERIRKKKETVRSALAPSWAVYEESEHRLKRTLWLPGRVVKSFIIRDFGSDLSDRAIRNLRALPIPMNISLFFEPQPRAKILERVNSNIDAVQGEMFNLQSRIVKSGGDPTILPPAVEDREADARDLRNFLRDEDQDVAWFLGIITVFAEDEEKLRKYTDMLVDQGAPFSLDVWNPPLFQEETLCGSLPLAADRVALSEAHRSLCTAERAAMVPFSSINIANDPKKSYYMGVERVTRADIFIDPDSLMSPHSWVFGPTGSGKSMQLKGLLEYTWLQHPRNATDADGNWTVSDPSAPQWWIYDFHDEYGDVSDRHGGASFKFGPGHEACLNPMDMANEEGVLTMKDIQQNIDFFIALIESIMGRAMTQREKSELDDCLIKTYKPYLNLEQRPTLHELHAALKGGGDAVAGEIADSIKMYVTGTMSSFAQQTNVHADRWINRFDMSELGETMQTIGMLSTLQHVRMAAYANNREGRDTYLLIEEIQKLFSNDAAVRVFLSFFAEMRKYGLHIICVTQLPKAVLEHPMVSDLFDNSSLFVFLPQQEQEATLIRELFKLSENQYQYIAATAEKGTGLIIADGTKVGFDNRIPKDSLLYERWNTDPGKRAREKAVREAVDAEESKHTIASLIARIKELTAFIAQLRKRSDAAMSEDDREWARKRAEELDLSA